MTISDRVPLMKKGRTARNIAVGLVYLFALYTVLSIVFPSSSPPTPREKARNHAKDHAEELAEDLEDELNEGFEDLAMRGGPGITVFIDPPVWKRVNGEPTSDLVIEAYMGTSGSGGERLLANTVADTIARTVSQGVNSTVVDGVYVRVTYSGWGDSASSYSSTG